MPSFLNRQENYILTTSFKVMYSTLSKQPSLTELSPRSLWVMRLLVDGRLRHFMLTRHPYSRLVSFYFEKFVRVDLSAVSRRGWQRCQRIFFPHVGVSGDEDAPIIRDRLRSLSFERFVGLLDEVAWLDEHLMPQVESRYRRLRPSPLRIRLRVDRFVRIETDLDFMRTHLRLDPSVHENKSESVPPAEIFTPALYEIANRVYSADFTEFGYARA